MTFYSRSIGLALLTLVGGICQQSCKQMVTVPAPLTSITTSQVFTSDVQASAAMAAVYSLMINNSGQLGFSNGSLTILSGMSADELYYYGQGDPNILAFTPNQLLAANSYTNTVWTSAYKVIYGANAVIEGVAASTATALTDSGRRELTGEAKFARAFAYFYLVNIFGDVPLALTVDFNKTRYMARTPADLVYQQIIQDLKDAQSVLQPDYSAAVAQERIIPNRWAATAMLARVYLYRRDYANAAAQAGSVINNTALYSLVSNPDDVFLINSKEAIWQLKQATVSYFNNATAEGFNILPGPLTTGLAHYCLTASLLNAFEPGDLRRTAWAGSTDNSYGQPSSPGITWYPYKYRIGVSNAVSGGASSEYYMAIRLAELYLIRAEAEANGAPGGTAAAIADLNVLRSRAGLADLPAGLTQAQVITAVAHERQVELFAEWGHRWLDLKRTGQAHAVLSTLASKQPWLGDYQLLYPVPPTEIQSDNSLLQNPGY